MNDIWGEVGLELARRRIADVELLKMISVLREYVPEDDVAIFDAFEADLKDCLENPEAEYQRIIKRRQALEAAESGTSTAPEHSNDNSG